MNALSYLVIGRNQPVDRPTYTNVWKQFDLAGGSTVDAHCVVDDPRLSLWSLDFEKNGAVFVECESNDTLLEAPLLYLEQYKQARRVVWLDMDTFHHIAANLTIPISTADMAWLYSTGRCGSTLLHNMLSKSSSVVSVSEADAHAGIALRRDLDPAEIAKLLLHSTRFLAHRFAQSGRLLFFKSRLEVARIWDIQASALPGGKELFLYRNAIDVAQSGDRLTGSSFHGRRQWTLRVPLLKDLVRAWLEKTYTTTRAAKLRHVVDESSLQGVGLTCTPLQVLLECGWCGEFLLSWLSCVGAYTNARARGSAVVGLRYEDLTADTGAFLRALLLHLHLPESDQEICLTAAKRDAHAGTQLQRGNIPVPLDRRTQTAVSKIIANSTILGSADVVLENTLRPAAPEQ